MYVPYCNPYFVARCSYKVHWVEDRRYQMIDYNNLDFIRKGKDILNNKKSRKKESNRKKSSKVCRHSFHSKQKSGGDNISKIRRW